MRYVIPKGYVQKVAGEIKHGDLILNKDRHWTFATPFHYGQNSKVFIVATRSDKLITENQENRCE